MGQFDAPVPVVAGRAISRRVQGAALLAAIVLAAALGLGLSGTLVHSRAPAPALPGAVEDGWMPAYQAERTARMDALAGRVTDGWTAAVDSALTARSDALASRVTDGWATGLLH
jgi:hypothetical protein